MPKNTLLSSGNRVSSIKPLTSDVIWGRPVFRAPDMLNSRLVFDPIPFRTLPAFTAPRRSAAR